MELNLIATCTFGLESVLKREVQKLGYSPYKVLNGRIYFKADENAVARSNIFLRTADRVHILLKEFPAADFDELFDGVSSIPWEEIVNRNGRIVVKGRSKKSKIHSVPVAQSMTKKAVIERLKSKLNTDIIEESGTLFPVEIELENNFAQILLDTSGDPLFKRGYRINTGEAPIKETLAAGLILLSNWDKRSTFVDPFCGSGTLPIEAALLASNTAPGLNRHFLAMKWDFLYKSIWNKAGSEALDNIDMETLPEIIGYDLDKNVVHTAFLNAREAELDDHIKFIKKDVHRLFLEGRKGTIVTNPPYGLRISERDEVDSMYKALCSIYKKNSDWDLHLITAHPAFQEIFGNASKKRKLYNGNIKCNYYSYFNR